MSHNIKDVTTPQLLRCKISWLVRLKVLKNLIYRNYFIHNGGGVGFQRLSMDDVCAIIFCDDIDDTMRRDTTEADQKAKMLFTISRQMSKSEVLRGKLLARQFKPINLTPLVNNYIF